MSASQTPGDLRPRASWFWRVVFRIFYRFIRLLDPMVRSATANNLPGLDGVVELRVRGRRSGEVRRRPVTLLTVDGEWYVGHPNGESAWTRNMDAADTIEIDPPSGRGSIFRVVRLPPGPERDALIRATPTQQPFPANLIYRAALRHIAAVGTYYRLVPASGDA